MQIAHPAAGNQRNEGLEGPSGAGRRLKDTLAVAACVAISVLTAGWFTRKLFLTQDDLVFLKQAQDSRLNVSYAREQLFQHFSPASRVADYLVVHLFGVDYTSMRVIVLTMLGVGVFAFAWTVTGLVGRVWWRHLLTLLFAESLAIIHLTDWWTAAANILPATVLGVATIGAFVRYRRRGGLSWGVLTVVLYGCSLLTHEQSWLVFGYLILLDLLVLTPKSSIGSCLTRIIRDWRMWIPLTALTGAAVVNYLLYYYAELKPRPTVPQVFAFIRILFDEAFAPSAVGFRPLDGGVVPRYAWAIDVLVVVGAVVVTTLRSPRAWRPWVVFALRFLANALMVGLNRVGVYGPLFGRELYYVQAPAYLFILCLGCACAPGLREGRPVRARHAAAIGVSQPRKAVLLCLSAAVGLYQVTFFSGEVSQSRHATADVDGRVSRSYFGTLREQIEKLDSEGQQVVVVDGSLPAAIVIGNFAPYNTLSSASDLLGLKIRFGSPGPHSFQVSPAGSLLPDRVANG